jgi:hypothetical protein
MSTLGTAQGFLPFAIIDGSGASYGTNYFKKVSSAINKKVSVGSSSTEIITSNSERVSCVIVNDSDEVVYLNLSGTATMNEGIRLNANGGTHIESNYTGAISGICASGSKNVTVVEK